MIANLDNTRAVQQELLPRQTRLDDAPRFRCDALNSVLVTSVALVDKSIVAHPGKARRPRTDYGLHDATSNAHIIFEGKGPQTLEKSSTSVADCVQPNSVERLARVSICLQFMAQAMRHQGSVRNNGSMTCATFVRWHYRRDLQ